MTIQYWEFTIKIFFDLSILCNVKNKKQNLYSMATELFILGDKFIFNALS